MNLIMFPSKATIIFILSILVFTPAFASPSNELNAVGALGRIEPRSRVIRVSHNAGAEGVNLQQLFVNEGNEISKGETLAFLADHDKKQADVEAANASILALNAKLASERINLTYAEKEFQRYQSLAPSFSASRSLIDAKQLAFQQSQAIVRQLKAEIATAQANKKIAEEELKNTVILAPLSGTILKIHTWQGERIRDEGLLEMADLSQLDVVAEIYESDLPKIRVAQKADIKLNGVEASYSAIVREIGFQVRKNDQNDTDPLADRDNRIIEVRLTLDDRAVNDLRHQIYRQVQVRILM
ncbi:MAG: hypothetical protein BVN35_09965 [Proteobacteria bacterium ST_bin11]|nr:MAG: hypothetical protein BVN35_09965 [Proteobacteria bacterium ST_bin11]